jgi:methionyl-tRNA formyltransferase
MCPDVPDELVLRGAAFRSPEGIARLAELRLDYVVGVHFPYVVPPEVLALPRGGVLNLHPALLPYNRGWHTPSWAILDGTPVGATLHFMDSGVDTGDIVHQRELDVRPDDTANSLYARLLDLEVDVFRAAWPALAAGRHTRTPQGPGGTTHRKSDLHHPAVQRIELDEPTTARALLDRLRALTTNDPAEAAYFEVGDTRYRVRVEITPG